MSKILTIDQIRAADEYTIQHEPISSYLLMERASEAFVAAFMKVFPTKKRVRIFCGIGNNGGDGLAIGRLLNERGWEVWKYVVGDPGKGTEDFKKNLNKSGLHAIINTVEDLPSCKREEILIDALFGSGLSRSIEGIHAKVVNYLNDQEGIKASVDIPSGLHADKPIKEDSIVFEADYTISFERPKLVFFLPEYHRYVGEWSVVPIGLSSYFLDQQESSFYLLEPSDLKGKLPIRKKFTHKSEVGKLTLVAGSKGKMGAAILASKAAFKSGVGLLNVCCPRCGTLPLQIALPEAMVLESEEEDFVSTIPTTIEGVVALGPGLGTHSKTIAGFERFLKKSKNPMTVDADGLNILAKKKSLLKYLPANSILTPHLGEFKRLVGSWQNDFEKLEMLISFSKKYQVNMVLKGAYSAIADRKGNISFNPSGNEVLATAGSGDVLTGLVASLLAQQVEPLDALKLGVYLHGRAGDLLAKKIEGLGAVASDIIKELPSAISELSK